MTRLASGPGALDLDPHSDRDPGLIEPVRSSGTLKLRLLLRTLTQQLQCLVRAAQSLQLREAHQRLSRSVTLRSTRPLPAAQTSRMAML